MRLVMFERHGEKRLGAGIRQGGNDYVVDLREVDPLLPADLLLLLRAGASVMEQTRKALASAEPGYLIPTGEVKTLAPIACPGKILCVGHSYRGHIGIGREQPPEYPDIFCKTVNTIIGPGEPILIPELSVQVDYEAELMVVIGKAAWQVSQQEALTYVAGYTIFNDVSARDIQNRTSQWLLGKSFDTFGPMGPALVTSDEVPNPHCLDLELSVNGIPKQRVSTGDLIFSVPFLVSYLSQVVALEPGDVIATGTPAKLPEAAEPKVYLKDGDQVRIRIEKLGTLENPVMKRVPVQQKG